MKIAIMGFEFSSSNKGCEALTYSFVAMLRECLDEKIEIYNYSYGEMGSFAEKFPEIQFHIRRPRIKDIRDWYRIKKEFDSCDLLFDVTFGDGFSDIYGKRWNAVTNVLKTLGIWSRTPFILLPQTYGPYENPVLLRWAKYIIAHADLAYARDMESADYMNPFCKNRVITLTDMAFLLPYDKDRYPKEQTGLHIGLNVSSLLWDSEYAKKNRFGLKADYRVYIRELTEELLKEPDTVIHLIPHVAAKDYDNPENDVRSCEAVKRLFPTDRVVLSPVFEDPMDAKSYIAKMDFFIGARMHATIAAVSANVPTIPFAYSKKFKTMFGNLEYPYVLDAREMTAKEAVEKTMAHIKNREELREAAGRADRLGREKLEILRNRIREF